MRVGVGIDLVDVCEVRASVARFGDRYLRRIFTADERRASSNGSDVERLAASFAAKEATTKAIAAREAQIPWTSIELVSSTTAPASLRLSGNAAEAADRAGIFRLSVSVSTTSDVACAIVIAEATDDGEHEWKSRSDA